MSTGFDTRLAPWFEKRRWRVMAEKTGTITIAGVRYTYNSGEFVIDPPGVFVTPLGHRGRRGYLIIEIGEYHLDIPGSEQAFGEATLRRANEAFGSDGDLPVSGLPEVVS